VGHTGRVEEDKILVPTMNWTWSSIA